MSAIHTERVLVVPTAVFHRLGRFQGFCGDMERYLPALLDSQHVSYRPRKEVETDPAYKQLIPYAIFRHRDETGGEMVFQYTRGKGQDEARLRTKRSIGIGGHISITDVSAEGAAGSYREGMRRELAEEVLIKTEYEERCVGLINDDETEVGRVHLGIVHVFDVLHPVVYPQESEITESAFCPVSELLADLDGFESWSQICLRSLFQQ
jgi:predicted NUDIX family phosphoesterase